MNVGAGENHSICEIAEKLVGLSRVPLELVQDLALLRPTDETENLADPTQLRALGYLQTYSFEHTIADTLDY